MPQLDWVKSTNGDWLGLDTVRLAKVSTLGVHIVWINTSYGPQWLTVGKGDIASSLETLRSHPQIVRYRGSGWMGVTWAAVPAFDLDGVGRYVAERLQPLVTARVALVPPVPVNLPLVA